MVTGMGIIPSYNNMQQTDQAAPAWLGHEGFSPDQWILSRRTSGGSQI